MPRNKLYVTPAAAKVDGFVKAPVIGIQLGQTGYWPIYTAAPIEELNEGPVPDDVIASAVGASMFGWDAPIARKAIEFMSV